jgi:4a-hydroxytetrahydrobiopterin dehydratase
MSTSQTLSPRQVGEAELDGWLHAPGALATRIRTGDFATGLRLVNAVGEAAEQANHHPDLSLRYTEVDVRLRSHDVGGVTERDLEMARRIGALATEHGVALSCQELSVLELALDTPDRAAVLPFWEAVMRMQRTDAPDDLVDPAGALPLIWFQESGTEERRQRWHLDIWVDPSQVADLISAAEQAGGRLVTDEHAPSFWVLADPEGNKICLCTQQER